MNSERWRAQDQPLFILNRRPYRETSLLIDGLTPDHGRVSLIAKGARGAKSKRGALLQPFVRLNVDWQGRTELLTLTQAERAHSKAARLEAKRLYCGFYVNEITMYLLHRYDPHPALFDEYANTLKALADQAHDMASVLRRYECILLQEIGYPLILDRDVQTRLPIDSSVAYGYSPEAGPSVDFLSQPGSMPVDGASLLALQSGETGDAATASSIKRLMRFLIDHQLDGKIIKSRSLFS